MAANRCRYKRRAAVNKYDNGGWSERKRGMCGVRYGIPVYKSDHQKQRPVTVRTSHMSYGIRTHTHTKAHDDNIERETCVTIFPFFYFDVMRLYAISIRIKRNFWFWCETSFLFQIHFFFSDNKIYRSNTYLINLYNSSKCLKMMIDHFNKYIRHTIFTRLIQLILSFFSTLDF